MHFSRLYIEFFREAFTNMKNTHYENIYIVIVSTLLEYDISLQSLRKTRLMAMSYNLYFISKHVFYFIVRNIIR